MELRLKLSFKAIDDLNGILNYTIETWSEKQGEIYNIKIRNQIKCLTKKPELGKAYTEIKTSLLGGTLEKHIKFYQMNNHKHIENRVNTTKWESII